MRKASVISSAEVAEDFGKIAGKIVRVDEVEVKQHLGKVIRGAIEETLNAILDAEADELCKARRYERRAGRADTRAGHYRRGLQTVAGTVELKVPKLRSLPFETAIIERYREVILVGAQHPAAAQGVKCSGGLDSDPYVQN